MSNTVVALQASNFDLKQTSVDLLGSTRSSITVTRTVAELEAMRVERAVVPASKFGLETITGASCETGAQ